MTHMIHQNKCTCNPNENYFGTYKICVQRVFPFKTERYSKIGTKTVDIDGCILEEVENLWALGIQTVESCCGHNREQGYISVVDKDIEKMKQLGYEEIKYGEFRTISIGAKV